MIQSSSLKNGMLEYWNNGIMGFGMMGFGMMGEWVIGKPIFNIRKMNR
jgi:hypothetical protein